MRRAIISDIDGVLTTEPMFNPTNVGNEIPISMARKFLAEHKSNGAEIIYVTGRHNTHRKKTRWWLNHHKFPNGELIMRVDENAEPGKKAEKIFRWDHYYKQKCATITDIIDMAIKDRNAAMYIDDDKLLTNCMTIKYKLNGNNPEIEIINPYEENDILYFYNVSTEEME